jgi:hypothetical protein
LHASARQDQIDPDAFSASLLQATATGIALVDPKPTQSIRQIQDNID